MEAERRGRDPRGSRTPERRGHRPGSAQADGAGDAAAYQGPCVLPTRDNMQLLFCDIDDILKLVEVERMLTAYGRRGRDQSEQLSVVKNLLVRFNCDGYHLGHIVRYGQDVEDGMDKVLVQSGHVGGDTPPFQRIPVKSVSSRNPFVGSDWDAVGRGELAALREYQSAHNRHLTLQQAAEAAWRRRAAIEWVDRYAGEEALEPYLPRLLSELRDAAEVERLARRFQAEAPREKTRSPPPQPMPRSAHTSPARPSPQQAQRRRSASPRRQHQRDPRQQERRDKARSPGPRRKSTSPRRKPQQGVPTQQQQRHQNQRQEEHPEHPIRAADQESQQGWKITVDGLASLGSVVGAAAGSAAAVSAVPPPGPQQPEGGAEQAGALVAFGSAAVPSFIQLSPDSPIEGVVLQPTGHPLQQVSGTAGQQEPGPKSAIQPQVAGREAGTSAPSSLAGERHGHQTHGGEATAAELEQARIAAKTAALQRSTSGNSSLGLTMPGGSGVAQRSRANAPLAATKIGAANAQATSATHDAQKPKVAQAKTGSAAAATSMGGAKRKRAPIQWQPQELQPDDSPLQPLDELIAAKKAKKQPAAETVQAKVGQKKTKAAAAEKQNVKQFTITVKNNSKPPRDDVRQAQQHQANTGVQSHPAPAPAARDTTPSAGGAFYVHQQHAMHLPPGFSVRPSGGAAGPLGAPRHSPAPVHYGVNGSLAAGNVQMHFQQPAMELGAGTPGPSGQERQPVTLAERFAFSAAQQHLLQDDYDAPGTMAGQFTVGATADMAPASVPRHEVTSGQPHLQPVFPAAVRAAMLRGDDYDDQAGLLAPPVATAAYGASQQRGQTVQLGMPSAAAAQGLDGAYAPVDYGSGSYVGMDRAAIGAVGAGGQQVQQEQGRRVSTAGDYSDSRGGSDKGRVVEVEVAAKGGSKKAASASGSIRFSSFWDPMWVWEDATVQLLQQQPMRMQDLRAQLPLPACWDQSADAFRVYIVRRKQLFWFDNSSQGRSQSMVRSAKGATAFLLYKRSLLQLLADRRPRLEAGAVTRCLRPPTGFLQRQEADANFVRFVAKYLGNEVGQVRTPEGALLELRPFDVRPSGRGASSSSKPPTFQNICAFFTGKGSCKHGGKCFFAHVPDRQFHD